MSDVTRKNPLFNPAVMETTANNVHGLDQDGDEIISTVIGNVPVRLNLTQRIAEPVSIDD